MGTLHNVTGTYVGAGVQFDLGDTDSIFVGVNSVIGCTDRWGEVNMAIYAAGSVQSAMINGEVSGFGETVKFGWDTTWNHSEDITIGATGTVYSEAYDAVLVDAYSSTVRNDGAIYGSNGIEMDGSAQFTQSAIYNSGTITADLFAIKRSGSENFYLQNSGTITGGASAFFASASTGAITIRNSGIMDGIVYFGSGDDTYDGRGGSVSKVVLSGAGNDTLTGGSGTEKFEGNAGRDVLTGGLGADEFYYLSPSDSTIAKAGRDLITDFSHSQHDLINVVGIDAKSSTLAADDAFKFIGTAHFDGHEGELRYEFSHGHTFIEGDTDGNKHADFEIELGTHVALVKGDFVL